jgi:hypothetical protein
MADDIPWADPNGNGVEEMYRLFGGADLLAPPVPVELRPQVRQVSGRKWAYATRVVVPMTMYLFRHYILEVLKRPVEDYVAVSHAGHGVNSYAINYQLVHGPVAVFAQEGWGGIYYDEEQATANVNKLLGLCTELVEALPAVSEPHRRGGRLIVVESPLRDASVCEWLAEPLGDEVTAIEWYRQRVERVSAEPLPALTEAIRLVRAGQLPPG